jgi:predicted ferric reductase
MTLEAKSSPHLSRPRRALVISSSALLIAYGTAVVMPLILAPLSAEREESFWRELCIGVGLIAFSMLLLQFILSGRLETLSGRVGIDLTMRWHQLAARTIAVLVILHPLLLIASSGPQSVASAVQRFGALLTTSVYASGVGAWLVVLMLIIAGLLRHRIPVSYEVWRIAHALAGIIAAGLSGHHAFQVGLYSNYPAVGRYWHVLLVLAIGVFVLIYVVKPLNLSRSPYRIRNRSRVAEGIWEITLEPIRKTALDFAAGQFAWFSFQRFPWPGLDHPFSIASCPAQLPEVRVLIKETGDFTRTIGRLPVGACAYIDGPHGNFVLRGRDGDSLCLIAGGIGIAPIMSILRDLHARREKRPITLIFAARGEDELVHRDEIDRMSTTLDMRVTYVVEQRSDRWEGRVGILDLPMLRSAVRCKRPQRCLVFLCGPTAMMLAVESHLSAIGVPPRQIVYERFVYD